MDSTLEVLLGDRVVCSPKVLDLREEAIHLGASNLQEVDIHQVVGNLAGQAKELGHQEILVKDNHQVMDNHQVKDHQRHSQDMLQYQVEPFLEEEANRKIQVKLESAEASNQLGMVANA